MEAQRAAMTLVAKQAHSGGKVVVSVEGSICGVDSLQVRSAVLEVFSADTRVVYLDLAKTVEIDSVGLGTLAGIHATCRSRRVDFVILSPAFEVRSAIELTNLHRVLRIVEGTDAEFLRAGWNWET
jgi:anti-anti-sigma factor